MTSPNAQLELSAVMEFKNQDWIKNIAQADQSNIKMKHVNPNTAFPFQDDLSVGTIHGKNKAAQPKDQIEGTGAKDTTKVIKITKNTKTSACSPLKCKKYSPPSWLRRGARVSPQSVPKLPPVPIPQSAASLPMLPSPEQPGQHPLQLRDRQPLPAPVPKVELMVGWVANSCQQLLL